MMSRIENQAPVAIPLGEVVALSDLIDYAEHAVISRTLLKSEVGTLTLFSFAAGQGLSEHTAPFHAMVQVLEGSAAVTIDGKTNEVSAGKTVVMPAHVPHSVHATTNFKMLLTMIRG